MSDSQSSRANEAPSNSQSQDNIRDSQSALEHRLSVARDRADAARAAAAQEQAKEAEMRQERDRGARER
jgi:hypothetical protein